MKIVYKGFLYLVYLLLVTAIGVELIGGLFLVSDGTGVHLKREQLFVADEKLGYGLKPGFKIAGSENRLYPGASIAIGSHGLRSSEFDGRQKIIVLGDSVAFGYGLNVEDTIAGQLEKILDGRYQVINAGVPGYNFNQWQILGERLAAATQPKIVVVVVNANDFQARYYPVMGGATVSQFRSFPWDTGLPVDDGQPQGQWHSLLGWLFRNLSSGLSLTRIAQTPPHNDNTTDILYESELKQIGYYNSPAPAARERFDEAVRSMMHFANQITAGGAGVVFAFLPYRVSALQPSVGADQRFADLANRIKTGPAVAVVELAGQLDDASDFIPGDSHTSKRGNQVIAKALSETITSLAR